MLKEREFAKVNICTFALTQIFEGWDDLSYYLNVRTIIITYMQRYLRIFCAISFITLFSVNSYGQDDCIADPPPVQCVCQTSPICGFEVLDNYCLEMESFQTPFGGFPDCPQNVLNNPNWFSFVAGDENLVLQISPSAA